MKNLRQAWSSRIGIILAVAGSAVGLGNFLRFPTQAVNNGGGAFLIPYFLAFFLLGLPLMWIEWAIGRYGGLFGRGSAPLIFNRLWRHHVAKYLGAIGIFGPLAILVYYMYIESWLLGYAYHSLTGSFAGLTSQEAMLGFLQEYQGVSSKDKFLATYIFFLIVFAANFWIIYRGVKSGIEVLCKIAMPLLFIFGVILAIRTLTLDAPNPVHPEWNVQAGLGFLWNPDLSLLKDSKIWLAAAGQMLFTLSVGIGVIITYSSYLKKDDDIVLSGLTSSSLNEFAEVILGGTIVIPLAVMFFGVAGAKEVAGSGSFNIGFVTMPLIFSQMQFGMVFSFLWYLLLFLAGITSSVSLLEPAVAFLSDDLGISRKKAVTVLAITSFILCQFPIFFLANGVVDELDFWAGTFCLIIFATAEYIIFVWIFGIEKAWEEIHHGAQLRIPKMYHYIIRYITPLFLLFILGFWFYQEAIPFMLMKNVPEANMPYVLATRVGLLLVFVAIALLVRMAHKNELAENIP